MKRVTGIGGIFFKAKDPAALREWYRVHLGVDVQDWGGAAFRWTDAEGNPTGGTTVWSIGAADNDYYAPSTAPFMVNYRVADLAAIPRATRSSCGSRPRAPERAGATALGATLPNRTIRIRREYRVTEPGTSKQRLYALAGAGFLLQIASIFLIVARDVSVAVVAPLLMIGMFMTFAPAIAAKKAAGK